jgi:hypothetical protein
LQLAKNSKETVTNFGIVWAGVREVEMDPERLVGTRASWPWEATVLRAVQVAGA